MACSLPHGQPGPQQQPQYQSTMYTTFIPFTDYSQWERRPQKQSVSVKHSKDRVKAPSLLQVGYTDSTKGSRHKRSGCCNSARGSVIVRSRPGTSKELERRLASGGTRLPTRSGRSHEAAKLRVLRLQVSSKKISLEGVRQHSEEMLSMNLSLIRNIQHVEDRTHSNVDDMLEKYVKFKGAISRLREKSSEQLQKAKEELSITRTRLEAELSELRKTASKTKSVLQTRSQELQMFLNYKEKEFPVKVVKIEQLKEQCDILREGNEMERIELDLQIAEERERCQQQLDAVRQSLEKKATEVSLVKMKRSVHEKAIQNRIMEKEIILHEKKRSELQGSISTLTSDISKLKQAVIHRSESRRQLSVTKLGKCSPNTEFMLDIPRQQHFQI